MSFEEYKVLHVHEVALGSFDNYTDEYHSLRWKHDADDDESRVIDLNSMFMVPKWEKDCHNINTEVVVMLANSWAGRVRKKWYSLA